MSSGRSAGYSLLEVVITLVIVGMITGLLFDGVGGAARLTLRLSDAADRMDRAAIAGDWWRTSIVSAAPAEASDPPALVGDRDQIDVQTNAPLHARIGSMRAVGWRLLRDEDHWNLIYAYDEQTWTIATTRSPQPEFAYCCDAEGNWEEAWTSSAPPALVALNGFFATPILAHPRSRTPPEQPLDMSGVGLR